MHAHTHTGRERESVSRQGHSETLMELSKRHSPFAASLISLASYQRCLSIHLQFDPFFVSPRSPIPLPVVSGSGSSPFPHHLTCLINLIMDGNDEYFHLLVIPHLSSDCLASIAAETKKPPRVNTSCTSNYSFAPETPTSTCPPGVIQAIYASCRYLKLGFDVHHLAVELFELFMNRLVKDVAEMKQSRGLSPGTVLATQRKMRGQVWMRLLTCILLAAKYQSNRVNLSQVREKIVEIVSRIDPVFTTKSLDSCEMRVLRVSRNES